MKSIFHHLPVTLLAVFSVSILGAADAVEIEIRELHLNAKDYKDDRVTYVAPLTHLSRNIPEFLEREGYDDDKDFIIGAGNAQIPVCAEGSDDLEKLLLEAPRGSLLRVTGKIREADVDPRGGFTSGYYLELEDIEIVERVEGEPAGERPQPPRPRWRRPGPAVSGE